MVHLEQTTFIAAPAARCFDLARSVEVHLAGNVHFGEQAIAAAGVTSGLIGPGQRVTWRARHFAVRQTLTSEMTAFDPPRYFQDTMLHGAFRFMQHDHYFNEVGNDQTEMRDVFRFAAPVPIVGRITEILILRRYMAALLSERNAVIKKIAEGTEWRKFVPENA